MTEDELEERSFRSLLPSEAHRRGTKDKSRHQDESEDDGASHSMALVPRTHNILKVRGQCFQIFVGINSCVNYYYLSDFSDCQPFLSFFCCNCRMQIWHFLVVKTASHSLLWTWCASTWRMSRWDSITRVPCCIFARKRWRRKPKLSLLG